MTRMSIWLEILFALLRRYHNTELYHGYSPNHRISLFSVETSAGGTSRTIIHGNVRMHQHFSMRFRLGKRRPSNLLRNFRQIG